MAQSEVVEVKDGKFRPTDDPTSWPLTLDQPDPVISPKPEAEVDNSGDSIPAVKPLVVSEKSSKPATSLNPNVPEFVPMASKVKSFSHYCFIGCTKANLDIQSA